MQLKQFTGGRVHYVYLMVNRHHDSFKIGVSVNPSKRASTLKQSINLGMSVQAGFSKVDAYRIERRLHALYRDRNVSIECPGSVYFDGYTEWFSFDCFAACRMALAMETPLISLERIRVKAGKKVDWLSACLDHIRDFGAAQVCQKWQHQV